MRSGLEPIKDVVDAVQESLRKLERALEACLEILKENGRHLRQ